MLFSSRLDSPDLRNAAVGLHLGSLALFLITNGLPSSMFACLLDLLDGFFPGDFGEIHHTERFVRDFPDSRPCSFRLILPGSVTESRQALGSLYTSTRCCMKAAAIACSTTCWDCRHSVEAPDFKFTTAARHAASNRSRKVTLALNPSVVAGRYNMPEVCFEKVPLENKHGVYRFHCWV